MKKKCVECEQEFEFKTHNQKYCSNQCCRVATNKRIMQKYYEKRRRLAGEERLCAKCSALLSKYNSMEICSFCDRASVKEKTSDARREIANVIIGLEKKSSKKSARN